MLRIAFVFPIPARTFRFCDPVQSNQTCRLTNIFLKICTSFFLLLISTLSSNAQSDTANPSINYDCMLVENPPEFPGGEQALLDYIRSNVQYPKKARKKNIQGTVYISFIVEMDGKVTNVRVLRGIGGGCDEEAVRVVSSMPDWKPGYQDGEPVRVQFNLPIRFILRD